MSILLQISLCASNASVGGIAKNIGDKAVDAGWESYITYTDQVKPVKCKSKLIRISNKIDFFEHVLETRLFDRHGLASRLSTQRLIKLIDRIKPDIIQLQNLHGYYVCYPKLFEYIKKKNIPVVWTLHDCWSFTGHCTYFDAIGCQKWMTECHDCPNKSDYPQSWFIDASKKNFGLKKNTYGSYDNLYIVPVSEWLGDFARQSFLSKAKIHVIHNGIDVNRYQPTENNLREKYNIKNKFIILGVANGFGTRKGLDDFIRLSELLPPEKYQIILVGVMGKEKDKLNDKIISLERTSNQMELICFYSIADVFVNPTYEDNYPTTNLESMACGTPVITYQTGGSPESVDEETGIVVPKGDLDGLLRAIDIVYKNTKLFYTDKCRQKAENEFDKDKCFGNYIDLYNEILIDQNC